MGEEVSVTTCPLSNAACSEWCSELLLCEARVTIDLFTQDVAVLKLALAEEDGRGRRLTHELAELKRTTVSREMHENTLARVEQALAKEWPSAQSEVFESNNYGWATIAAVAIDGIRHAARDRQEEVAHYLKIVEARCYLHDLREDALGKRRMDPISMIHLADLLRDAVRAATGGQP